MEKLGTKLVYHKMFKWCQFQHSIVKVDCGLITAFILTCFCFGITDFSNIVYIVLDSLTLIFGIANVITMKYFLRYEKKPGVIVFLIIRSLFEVYISFRTFLFKNSVDSGNMTKEYFKAGYGLSVTYTIVAVNFVILIGEIITSIKCIGNFGKGLREMINKQINDTPNQSEMTETEESM